MQWFNSSEPIWNGEISNKEAKQKIAGQVAQYAKDNQVIGVGSGTTAFLTLIELSKKVKKDGLNLLFIATSHEIAGYINQLGLKQTTLLNAKPDWSFDGADEVDPNNNIIKGRGGAFVREKLVCASSDVRYILVDKSKLVEHLGQKMPLPIEVIPEAVNLVTAHLQNCLGATPNIRPAGGKDGGVITEQGNIIMDIAIKTVIDPKELNTIINNTVGITGSGLFTDFDIKVITD